ncbi:uracil-DNA glycosylase [Mycobacterium heckeshornense]|uniref:Type-4 uracil-DNA glycosylase n=1 Tax=Mycobacterium heckeshornense TaxID=110505 RepID=A0A2G8B761_9MYCO|nr:UdgX family uracil-DNA binding protein [Mycobacterium heckeshornense]MCV7035995.1 UdgX family uracil-DNA binding protein [Mycobacterium heckeshornense]PIJ33609.1 uracil-DNA glycosylase [Mycobacterium heckeshornense]BCO36704.1 uracil-DNA glycosylase [Mycobacterium heckeshornense]BCQ09597.1 uracil-DNA glycosylase [Mycobacterium heckeshornense]
MAAARKTSAASYLPEDRDLDSLEAAANVCRGCSLYESASQTVFGHGDSHAQLMLVGEQPGDREDIEGLPFVGPAGRLLARALDEAGIDPDVTYQTNAVKHFKFTRKNAKRRIHQKPSRTEVVACRPWLVAEIEAVRPQVIVCLGATAAQSLLGAAFRISAHRGELMRLPREAEIRVEPEPRVVATFHPSAVVRERTERRHEMYQLFVGDLRSARASLAGRRRQRR